MIYFSLHIQSKIIFRFADFYFTFQWCRRCRYELEYFGLIFSLIPLNDVSERGREYFVFCSFFLFRFDYHITIAVESTTAYTYKCNFKFISDSRFNHVQSYSQFIRRIVTFATIAASNELSVGSRRISSSISVYVRRFFCIYRIEAVS